MKKLSLIVLSSVISIASFAQGVDTKAKAILDKLSAKTKSYTTIKAEFQYSISNKSEGINDSQTGKANEITWGLAGNDQLKIVEHL